MSKDPFGKAVLDFQSNNEPQNIITHSSLAGEDEIPVNYLFRNYKEMPSIEQKALDLCKGKILDVGCGAGSHALYLQNKGKNVTAIDISEGAIEVCKLRGIQNASVENIWEYSGEKFDTILILMNGTGICGKLNKLDAFLKHLKSLLKPNGQILIDSSDIIYMFEDENGEYWIDASQDYYGEVVFSMEYKGEKSNDFDWLYVDFNTFQNCANYNGFLCELIEEGEHYDYLARLTVLED
ncbi:class I SAM-dependent methyltransferase [Aureivirga marina]|uniref:class I SAM-dependent methyltransferase n=1 Tax=Aureivirga marina TaxID=1182451 RepID=UPI0018CA2304|nr:class I SAM-dependent methyltransferase [Aureivirga marina]